MLRPSRRSPLFAAVAALAVAVLAVAVPAQRALTHDDYDQWKSIRGTTLTRDGLWVAYQVEPQWGDGELVVRSTTGEIEYRRARGTGARFTADGRWCVFTIAPSKVEERQKKIEELAKKKGEASGRRGGEPAARSGGAGGGGGAAGGTGGDGEDAALRERGELAVLDLQTGAVEVLGKIKRMLLAEEQGVVVFLRDGDKKDEKKDDKAAEGEGEAKAEGADKKPARDPLAKKRKDGARLRVRDLASGSERSLDDVVEFGLLPKATWLWYSTSSKTPAKDATYGLFAMRLDGSATHTLVAGFADFGGFAADRRGTALAFTCNRDDFAAEKPRRDLWLWTGSGEAQCIVHPGAAGVADGLVAGDGVQFTRDGGLLLVSLVDAEKELPPMLADEKVQLDLWHWNDGQLQTEQQKRTAPVTKQRLIWQLAERRFVGLGGGPGEQVRFLGKDGARAIAADGRAYEKLASWDARYEDVQVVNTVDGSRTRVLEKHRGQVQNSPSGSQLLWFGPDLHWWSYDVATQQRRDLTGTLGVPFHRTDEDTPGPAPAWGIAGFTKNDAAVLLYDEFDIWQVTFATGAAVCVTDGYGRQNQTRLRVQRLPREDDDEDDDGALAGELVLTTFAVDSKAEGICTDTLDVVQRPRRLLLLDEKLGELQRARKADRWVFTRSTFAQFPDLWTTDGSFAAPRRLSDANPQQQQFRWGNARLVHWRSADGTPLEGVLAVPDDFDPKRHYPMVVYFYERMAQNLHSYVAPAPGTSPNASYYVSNGYLWFMPDIVYTEGYPGESCVKCVVSGVQSLVAQGFVDERAIGAAGHSWGGYQTAFLVTRTDIFAAVESGAPVCDMLSAYGGIRYETGISRQFQYERTQSRIGGTPWERPLRYLENSPIHFADKVHTPVLILHNDKDGAVPWTQGIEYYTALRRLGREAYLANYNGEGLGLRLRQNQRDWTRRMAEYFDHHLRGAPTPAWMKDGVSFRDREREKLPFARSVAEVEAAAAAAAAKAAEANSSGPAPDAANNATATGDGSAVPAVEPKAAPASEPAKGGERPRRRLRSQRIVRAAVVAALDPAA